MRVGDVAKRSGVTVATLHFYERKGLIRSKRNGGNQREYERDVLRRIAIIRVGQMLGFKLTELKKVLGSLPQDHAVTKAEWARLATQWAVHLDARMQLLKRLKQNITGCIGCGCLSMARCMLLNKDDVLVGRGSGPKRLLIEIN